MIFRLLLIISTIFSTACYSLPEGNSLSGGEVSIAHLKSLCRGDHYRIVDDYTIRGVVVATDWLGELYKSVVIVDKTGGLEVAVELRNISEYLPIFSEVTILCNGLMLSRIGGKIELGAPPTGEFPLDNIGEEMFDRYIRVVGSCEDFAPVTKRISEIGVGDVSAIIRFDNIRLCDEEWGLSWCDMDEEGNLKTTYRTFLDDEGNTIAVRTLPSCLYANEKIPITKITVVGVIDFSDNRYFLRIVNKSVIPVFQ